MLIFFYKTSICSYLAIKHLLWHTTDLVILFLDVSFFLRFSLFLKESMQWLTCSSVSMCEESQRAVISRDALWGRTSRAELSCSINHRRLPTSVLHLGSVGSSPSHTNIKAPATASPDSPQLEWFTLSPSSLSTAYGREMTGCVKISPPMNEIMLDPGAEENACEGTRWCNKWDDEKASRFQEAFVGCKCLLVSVMKMLMLIQAKHCYFPP